MTKLSDTQSIILSAAAQRGDGNLLPLPSSLRGGAATKVVGALLTRGLIREQVTDRLTKAGAAMNTIWRNDTDGRGVLLLVTAAGLQAIGVEPAAHSVQVNAVAQNFVDNPTYFPADVQANPRFQERLAREVPLGRLVSAREDALFAAYLCSSAADCFVGQVFPVCGGWVGR